MEDRNELIRQLKKIEIRTKCIVEGLQSGLHHSLFKGQGVEFAEIREYVPGDDIRSIDWNVTARYNHPFIKEHTEERDQTFYFVVDISGSGRFGLQTSKQKKMLEVTASLAFAALRNNDRIGLCLFSDRVEKFIPAKKGKKHLVLLLNTLIGHKPSSQKTDLGVPIRFLSQVLSRKSSVIILSDFMSPQFSKPLRIIRRRHEVISIRITDPREREIPDIGFIELEDAETGEQILIDTSDGEFRKQYAVLVAESDRKLSADFSRTGISSIPLLTDESYEIPLRQFFRGMKKRRGVNARIL